MVERGQPWRCITDHCTNGTHDESHRCKTCRKKLSELLEASFERFDITCHRCGRHFPDATTEQYHQCPAVYSRILNQR
ncbi:hypothetical protein CH263_13415 [Rhodococcus sp. 06-1059B-a]|nr:hypothetical protein [Rhodococcus sp. 06-1059B-a]OZD65137.1 hypothetical protein CH263_13415 [Rhodococcus sp. 06-1059B-a]